MVEVDTTVFARRRLELLDLDHHDWSPYGTLAYRSRSSLRVARSGINLAGIAGYACTRRRNVYEQEAVTSRSALTLEDVDGPSRLAASQFDTVGIRRRVMIAMALRLVDALVIGTEPGLAAPHLAAAPPPPETCSRQ
jgi:hypothetical protein